MRRLRTNRHGSRLWSRRVPLAEDLQYGSPTIHPNHRVRPIDNRLPALWRKVAGFLPRRIAPSRLAFHRLRDQIEALRPAPTSQLPSHRPIKTRALGHAFSLT